MSTTSNPYIGPRTFKEDERDRFFGRDREANELLARVLSEQEIVFYAQSGAGKSSLVNTCLVPDLKRRGFEVLLGRVGGDARAGLEVENIFAFNLLRGLSTGVVDETTLARQSLDGFLAPAGEVQPEAEEPSRQPRALIIDQFEEIFSTHHEAWDKRTLFFEQLARALAADPRLRVLLVMREDYIAYLDPYAYLLQSRFRIRYYMQRLEAAAALKAVKEPVKGKDFARPYEADTAEKLVDDLRTIKVTRPDGGSAMGLGQFVEPLYLQVICYELWNNLPASGSTITMQNVQDVGDVSTSLGNYYARRVAAISKDEKVSESKIRKWFTEELISSAGVRNMVLEESGETSAGLENRVIRALSDLIRAEQRGGSVFYELTHDRLVEPIMSSNKKWFDEHLSALQKQAALWDSEGRKDSWLLTDEVLADVEKWAREHEDEIGANEREFLAACRKLQKQLLADREAQQRELERQRRELEMAKQLAEEQARSAEQQALANQRIRKALRTSRIVAGVASLLLVVAIFLGVQSYQNQRSTEMQVMINASAVELSGNNTELATRLAYQALINFGDHGEAEEGLANLADPMDPRLSSTAPFLIPNSSIGVGAVSYSPQDGGQTLAAGYTDGSIFLVDVGSRRPIGDPFAGHTAPVTSLAFSPDGQTLASSSQDGTIIVWDLATHELKASLTEHTSSVASIAFSPDGTTLASASDDTTIILWDMDSLQPIGEPLSGHTGAVTSVAFSPDGRVLASGSFDLSIILWDVSDVRNVIQIGQPLTGHTDWVNTLAFSPDGTILASGGDTIDRNIILWDLTDLENVQMIGEPLMGHTYEVTSLAFSPDGKMIASVGGDDSTLIFWDVATREPIGEPLRQDNYEPLTSVAFSPDGATVVTGNSNRTEISLWNADTREQKGSITDLVPENVTAVQAMSFSSDGAVLALTPDNLLLWKSGNDPQVIGAADSGQTDPSYHLESILHSDQLYALSPDGRLRVEGESGSAVLMENASRSILARVRHGGSSVTVTAVAFSPDGKYIASGDDDSVVRIWEAENGRQIGRTHLEKDEPAAVAALAFSPDGSRIAIAYSDSESTIEVWDIESEQKIFVVSNRQQKNLSYTVVSSVDRKPTDAFANPNERTVNADSQNAQLGNPVADILYSQDGLFIVYQNGVVDHWDIWSSRADLRKYAEAICGNCTLSTTQRLEYGLYAWPMRVHDSAGYIIFFLYALYYGFCLWQIRRSVFKGIKEQAAPQGFTWKKLFAASIQGAVLILVSVLTWFFITYIEDIYYFQQETRPTTTDALVLFAVPFGLWSGGVYSHLTRLQPGKWSGLKRTLLSALAGAIGGTIAGFLVVVVSQYSFTRHLTDVIEILGVMVFVGILAGILGIFGSLIYIWSEGKKTWQVVALHVLFGVGLFFTNKQAKRKWIYPIAVAAMMGYWLLVAFDLDYSSGGQDLIDDGTVAAWAALGFIIYLFSFFDLRRSLKKNAQPGVDMKLPVKFDPWIQVWWRRGLIVWLAGALLGSLLLYIGQGFYLDIDTAGIILIVSIILGAFGWIFYPHKSSYTMTAVLGSLGAILWFPVIVSMPIAIWFGLGSGFILSAIISRILHAMKKI